MSTAVQTPAIAGTSTPHPARTALRSSVVLLAALALTVGVLVALASVVDNWA